LRGPAIRFTIEDEESKIIMWDDRLVPFKRRLERIFGKKKAARIHLGDGDDITTDAGEAWALQLEEEEAEDPLPCGSCWYCHNNSPQFCGALRGDYDDTTTIASFELAEMTACCGVSVYTNPQVEIELTQDKEMQLRRLLYDLAAHIARENRYGSLMYTQITDNEAEMKAIAHSKWQVVNKFQSPRTRNTIWVMQMPAKLATSRNAS
jgi:hypothetical protein